MAPLSETRQADAYIEVTPAMIDVGVEAAIATGFFSGGPVLPESLGLESLVETIYRRMSSARFLGAQQGLGSSGPRR